MRLVDSIPWQAAAVDAPPVKLRYEEIEPPSDIEVTYIGVAHHMIAGAPDYMRAAFEETDVLVQEAPGWDKRLARGFQDVANGSYTALKEALEACKEQEQRTPGMGEWNEAFYTQLYGSKVRVAMADYPDGHPNGRDEIKLPRGGYERDPEAVHRIYAARDRYILTSMVEKISELRRMVPDIRSKSPLRVLMLFGAAHYAVHDALAAAAEEQGTASYASRLLFQESAGMILNLAEHSEAQTQAKQRATDYQDWLRTPEVSTLD